MDTEQKGKEIEARPVHIDFTGEGTGTKFEPVVIPEGDHTGKFTAVNEVMGTDFKTGAPKLNFVFLFAPDGIEKEVPFWVPPSIAKAWKPGVSNSRLFDFLDALGFMEEAQKTMGMAKEVNSKQLLQFCEQKLLGVPCKVNVETKARKSDGAMASKVRKVYKKA